MGACNSTKSKDNNSKINSPTKIEELLDNHSLTFHITV